MCWEEVHDAPEIRQFAEVGAVIQETRGLLFDGGLGRDHPSTRRIRREIRLLRTYTNQRRRKI